MSPSNEKDIEESPADAAQTPARQPQHSKSTIRRRSRCTPISAASPARQGTDYRLRPEPAADRQPTEPIAITQRIITNFFTAKRMLHALQLTIQRHEATFGVLETDVQRRVQPHAIRPGQSSPVGDQRG